MSKLNIGDKMPNFIFDTPFEKNIQFETAIKDKKTALIFLRYYGCTLCQLDIANFKKEHDKIAQSNGQLFIVLQSNADNLAQQLISPDALPFKIICDPDKKLYEEFDIKPAKTKLGMVGFKTMAKVKKAENEGHKHGEFEGDEMQLPASFIIDEKGIIKYTKYGKSVDDVLETDEIIKCFNT